MNRSILSASSMLLAAALACGTPLPGASTQTPSQPTKAATPKPTARFLPQRLQQRALLYYSEVWGVDSLQVKYTEAGEMVRFSYRVVDPEKAKALNDKKIEPSLEDPQAGVKLTVPKLEYVGKFRQSSEPEAGKSYWMGFSNVGRRVRPGHRVDVVIGHFRAHGLLVN